MLSFSNERIREKRGRLVQMTDALLSYSEVWVQVIAVSPTVGSQYA